MTKLSFLNGNVACMACDSRNIFDVEEASAVMNSARTLLAELSEARLLSVDRERRLMGHDRWEAQRRAEITMRLVTSPVSYTHLTLPTIYSV